MSHEFTIIAGTANPALASAIACELGIHVGACTVDRFPDGEVAVQLHEPVRRKEVFSCRRSRRPSTTIWSSSWC